MAKINAAELSSLSAQQLDKKAIEMASCFYEITCAVEPRSMDLAVELYGKSPIAFAIYELALVRATFMQQCHDGDYCVITSLIQRAMSLPYEEDWRFAIYAIARSIAQAKNSNIQAVWAESESRWLDLYKQAQILVAQGAFNCDLQSGATNFETLTTAGRAVIKAKAQLFDVDLEAQEFLPIAKKMPYGDENYIRYVRGSAVAVDGCAIDADDCGYCEQELFNAIFGRNIPTPSEQEQAAIKQQFPDFVAACEPFAEMPDLSVMAFVPALMNYWLQKTAGASERLIALCNE